MSAFLRAVCGLSISALLGTQLQAQTVIDSVFTPPDLQARSYSDPQNWSPPEVPNNSESRSYNVAIPGEAAVDLNARVTNLHANALEIGAGFSLSVSHSATISPLPGSPSSIAPRLSLTGGTLAVSGSFGNFDPVTRTLSGASFELFGKLQFTGADIVRNAASLRLWPQQGAIVNELGHDGLRNLAFNEAGAFFAPVAGFTAAADFTNAGTVLIEALEGIGQPFTVPAGHVYRQTAGETDLDGGTFIGDMEIAGGVLSGSSDFFFGYRGTIRGNLVMGAAMLHPREVYVRGSMQLGHDTRFRVDYLPNRLQSLWVRDTASLAGTIELEDPGHFPAPSRMVVRAILSGGLSGTFSNAPGGTRVPTTDGRGSFIVNYEGTQVLVAGYQRTPAAAQLLNISTRAQVGAGHHAAIAGFIIVGAVPKKVIVRGIGPSLSLSDAVLSDPVIALHGANGALITTNDNWRDTQEQEIRASGVPPAHQREAAIVATLPSGPYTVILRENGTNRPPAVGLVEVYDLDPEGGSKLGNLSTRGFVDAGNVLIGGIIAGGSGNGSAELTVRAIGAGLNAFGVTRLPDPSLEVFDRNGSLIAANDDYPIPAENYDLVAPGLFPRERKDSAVGVVLPPGEFTAVVRGKNNESGVALVEIFDLNL